jgi:hypothetical protein
VSGTVPRSSRPYRDERETRKHEDRRNVPLTPGESAWLPEERAHHRRACPLVPILRHFNQRRAVKSQSVSPEGFTPRLSTPPHSPTPFNPPISNEIKTRPTVQIISPKSLHFILKREQREFIRRPALAKSVPIFFVRRGGKRVGKH